MSRPIEVRRKHKKRSKTWELFQRYRHILTPDLCDTPSSSSSSSPVTSDEEEDSIKNDYYENIDYYQTQSGNHTRDNGREHVQRSGLVCVPQLGVDDELSPESRATSPAHTDRHESGYGSRMVRDASLGEGFRREQSNISHDQVLWRSYGASLDVRGKSPASGVRCLVSGVWCWVSDVGCLVLGVLCWVSSVGCLVLGVWCQVSTIWCPQSGVWCPVSGVWCGCTVSDVWCPVCDVWSLVCGVWCLVPGDNFYTSSFMLVCSSSLIVTRITLY